MRRRLIYMAALSMLVIGCADDSAGKIGDDSLNNDSNASPGGSNNPSGGGGVVPPELEFEFAQPAVLGTHVYVANESLNSVAVIDSRTLSIRTIPVGFNPSVVAGPTVPGEDARVFVLNAGNSTVSIISPAPLSVKSADVLLRANALDVSPDGSWALAWYDKDEATAGQTAGDLSSVSLIKADGTRAAVAVGFEIERIEFTADNARALVLSDDGVSVIEPAAIAEDTLVPPVAVLPPELQTFDRTDREVVLDPDGEYAIARIASDPSLTLTELGTGAQTRVPLPGLLSDLDWIAGTEPRVLGTLFSSDLVLVATVPDGLLALAAAAPPPDPDMGLGPADAGMDVGVADAGDMGMSDLGNDMEVGTIDGGVDMGATDIDMAPPMPSMPVPGVWYLPQPGLAVAEVSPDGSQALLFSTLAAERRGALLDLDTLEQRGVGFEKGVRGALANEDGTRFVVLHSRSDEPIPPGASPSDPAFIQSSWGLSIVDVASAATRLVLTEQEPGQTTLWQGDEGEQLYMIFEGSGTDVSLRDVLRIDLGSFATQTFRVPSLPQGIGRIDDAGRVYVDQLHPQGRITFVEVSTDRRQTVTGYQLNSGID